MPDVAQLRLTFQGVDNFTPTATKVGERMEALRDLASKVNDAFGVVFGTLKDSGDSLKKTSEGIKSLTEQIESLNKGFDKEKWALNKEIDHRFAEFPIVIFNWLLRLIARRIENEDIDGAER